MMGEVRLEITDSSDPNVIGTTWATDDEGNHYTVDNLTFERVRRINVARCNKWHPGFPEADDKWTGADWSNAMAGEAGEACNVVKKLRRAEFDLKGAVDDSPTELVDKLADEIADTFLYLQLLAEFYDIDMPAAIVRKFNAISVREDFPERLP